QEPPAASLHLYLGYQQNAPSPSTASPSYPPKCGVFCHSSSWLRQILCGSEAPFFCGLDRLCIHYSTARFWITISLYAYFPSQGIIDALEQAVVTPMEEVPIDNSP